MRQKTSFGPPQRRDYSTGLFDPLWEARWEEQDSTDTPDQDLGNQAATASPRRAAQRSATTPTISRNVQTRSQTRSQATEVSSSQASVSTTTEAEPDHVAAQAMTPPTAVSTVVPPAAVAPATYVLATVTAATVAPATTAPTTAAPATVVPATIAHTSVAPTTVIPAAVTPTTGPRPRTRGNNNTITEPSSIYKDVNYAKPVKKLAGGVAWTEEEDQLLISLRAQGVRYEDIATQHITTHSQSACEQRYGRMKNKEIITVEEEEEEGEN